MATPSQGPILTSEDFRDELECPVCYKIPTSTPIFQCEQGHIHCKNCHPKMTQCPICRLSLRVPTRALLAEKLLARLPMKCSFNGCDKIMTKELLDKHEKDCLFRKVKCPVFTCQQELFVTDIMFHVEAAHPVVRLANEDLPFIRKNFSMRSNKSLTPRSNLWAPCHMRLGDEDFFAQVTISDFNLYFWVYMVGHADKAKGYRYKIKLFNHENDEEMLYSGPVVSIDSLRNSQTHGSGLVLVSHQFKKYYSADRKINFEASIFRVFSVEQVEDSTEEFCVNHKRPAAPPPEENDQEKAGPSVPKRAKNTNTSPDALSRSNDMSDIEQSPQSPDPVAENPESTARENP